MPLPNHAIGTKAFLIPLKCLGQYRMGNMLLFGLQPIATAFLQSKEIQDIYVEAFPEMQKQIPLDTGTSDMVQTLSSPATIQAIFSYNKLMPTFDG